MAAAVETRPGTDPDRASFTTALEAARDQLTAAAGICPGDPADQPGAIGRAVLATLLPARRPRYSARKVKCSTSRYLNRDDGRPPGPGRHHRDRHHHAAPRPWTQARPRPATTASTPRPPRPPTRRQRITAIMTSHPPRDWSGHELALLLERQTPQHAHPARRMGPLGFLTRTGFGTYALNTPTQHPRQPPRPLTSRHCV